MIYIGIDPGLDGAIAFIGSDGSYSVKDAPTLTVESATGRKRQYDVSRMASWLNPTLHPMDACNPAYTMRATIEQVHAMPGQGVRSMFSMGYGLGVWEGILAGTGISFERVTPQRWKKVMLDGQGHDKDAARFKAQALFPKAELHLKKHDGRAEALLIAEYGRRLRA